MVTNMRAGGAALTGMRIAESREVARCARVRDGSGGNLHRDLDAGVFAAYGWLESPDTLDDETLLARPLTLNLERAQQPRMSNHPTTTIG
jgi:hypothetical protein